jgi:adenylate cyclase class 2
MRETEVKILEVDKTMLEKKLKKLGAKKVFEGKLTAILFKSKQKPELIIRLRKSANQTQFTVKKIITQKDAKIADEKEIDIIDFEKMHEILLMLGLKQKGKLSKYRVSYELGNIRFDFDKYPGVPCFLEVEAENKNELKKGVRLLGIDYSETKTWITSDIFKHYHKKL